MAWSLDTSAPSGLPPFPGSPISSFSRKELGQRGRNLRPRTVVTEHSRHLEKDTQGPVTMVACAVTGG